MKIDISSTADEGEKRDKVVKIEEMLKDFKTVDVQFNTVQQVESLTIYQVDKVIIDKIKITTTDLNHLQLKNIPDALGSESVKIQSIQSYFDSSAFKYLAICPSYPRRCP
ncbi:unnamed protein product [Euphydryas editha]|uniref:Uncharacterized protein n=1 Tax=Euphydryas editha TaxID=104508 RepID=A0AAU9U9E1_EUPED|nr:unnamed protein product [Euphydryas editha]